MKLSRLGRWSMNQPTRAWAQRLYVAPVLERLGGRLEGGSALEIGCGRGVGTEIILKQFGAARVQAFDLDPLMVELAVRRLGSTPGVRITPGDATVIEAADETFDAVFDFGAIHLIQDWPRAVAEVRRVLVPGGRFYFEEVAGRRYRSLLRWFAEGDPRSNRFGPEPFLAELGRHGFRTRFRQPRLPTLTGVIGDLIGVATRSE